MQLKLGNGKSAVRGTVKMKGWLGLVPGAALLLSGCARNANESPAARELFHEQDTGLQFTHRSGASVKFYMTEIMGAGVPLFNYDNDGDLDVFFVQSVGECKLFRNELVPSGTLRFTDVTAQSNIDFRGYGMGVATGDCNKRWRRGPLRHRLSQPGALSQ